MNEKTVAAIAPKPQTVQIPQNMTQKELERILRELRWKAQEASPAFQLRTLQRDLDALRRGLNYCGHVGRMHEAFLQATMEVKKQMHEAIERM